MFLKIIAAIDDQNPKDLEAFLDALNDKVEISQDIVVLPGMVADSLEAASPFENVHDKLLIDAIHRPDRPALTRRTAGGLLQSANAPVAPARRGFTTV